MKRLTKDEGTELRRQRIKAGDRERRPQDDMGRPRRAAGPGSSQSG